MGIGAKIKEALHADKESSHNSPNTHRTPGSYPEETVPRTHNQTSTHGSQELNTSSAPKTGNSGEYTHSPNTGTTGSTGLGHNTHHTSSSTGTTGGYSAGTSEGSHGPHNSKAGNMLDPRIDSDRDNRAAPGATGVGHNAHSTSTSGVTGTPGNYSSGSGTSEGLHGPHGSRVGNTLDPRVDSDRDNRAAPSHNNLGTTGTSSHNKLTKDPKDPYWGDAQGSRVNEPGTHTGAHDRLGHSLDPRQVNEEYNRTGGNNDYDPYRHDSPGATSNLPHRPIESKVTPRDRKIQEYDAPTASSDYQGHGAGGAGVGAGLAGGAAAGFGASKLADRHHEQDLRENNPLHGSHHHSGSLGRDTYDDNVGSRERTSGAGLGMNDPHAVNTATQPGTGVGTSMLDPYGTSSGHATSASHAPGYEHNRNTTSGHREGEHGPHKSRIANALDPRVDSDRDGSKRTGTTGNTGTGYPNREGDNLHRDRHIGEAGALGAGAAAYGAHEHHKHSPGAEYDRTNPSSHTEGAYSRPHEGAGYGAPGVSEGSHGPHSSRMQNALDPRVDSDRDNREAPSSSGIHGGSNYGNSHDHGRSEGSHLRLRDSEDRSHNTTGFGGIGSHDSGYGHENVGQGSSEYGAGHSALGGGASSGIGPDHFGPSHQGAKVFHKCHNCGADNDISKHFSKDAVYRLG